LHIFLIKGGKSDSANYRDIDRFSNFIGRVMYYSRNTIFEPHLFTSIIYVSRYLSAASMYSISTEGTEAKVWCAALLMADIYLNDESYKIVNWARILGVGKEECVQMRKSFFMMIDYNLVITLPEYQKWESYLVKLHSYFMKSK
jgi:hypothetical protein